MNSKKDTVKRLVIYLLIAFIPFWIILPVLNSLYNEPIYTSEKAVPVAYAVGVFGMLIPSIAHLITRLITKEGFKNSYLGLNFKGNEKYYVASVIVKLLEVFAFVILVWLCFAKDLHFSEIFASDEAVKRICGYILTIFASIIVFFPAFGEEWGWRGYMMPKLTELMGKPLAIIAGGILWGLWHAPLTISGHNFGTDYKFFPWLGILLMCVFCIFMNAFLTLLTEKTKSIYPASFCHMVNNNCGGMIFISLFGSEAFIEKISSVNAVTLMPCMMGTSVIVGTISFILIIRDEKTKKNTETASKL
ncbi:MAG: CPBP family intramembrane metalloprotease [Ruminiclostridium sp.]|nr:CPBP family intramembrane metalloprotease [Ruminiclostridium sp.]